jgi:methylenetetrahydrofolate--tRNA-(uracil-5-)-methyltransferase
VNFGLFPPLAEPASFDKDGRKFGRGSAKNLARKSALSRRALADLARWNGEASRTPEAAE